MSGITNSADSRTANSVDHDQMLREDFIKTFHMDAELQIRGVLRVIQR